MSRSVTDLALPTKEKCIELVDQARTKLRSPIVVISTLRTYPEQARLYAQGRDPNVPGPIITKAKPGFSWHQFGCAFDVAFLTQGKVTWSGPWKELGVLGEGLGLIWGGRFPAVDSGHFEYHHILRNGEPVEVTLAELRKDHDEYLARKGGLAEIQWYA